MILNSEVLAQLLEEGRSGDDPLVVTPEPDLGHLRESGSASIDLRLGTWFLRLRESKTPVLELEEEEKADDRQSRLAEMRYVPFGEAYVLHPRSFVLAASLEWIRLPKELGGYVIGKSSWGRRGLIIATAVGVHPGFTGCLTLELSNVGELPVEIRPGLRICQLFIHRVERGDQAHTDKTAFMGLRRPELGIIKVDPVAKALGVLGEET